MWVWLECIEMNGEGRFAKEVIWKEGERERDDQMMKDQD